jgi:uncharacterized protein (TIGR02118 family)
MVKLVCFVKRKPGMTRDEFYEHWEQRHGPLIASLPNVARHIVRYEQHRRTAEFDWMGTDDFDGVTIQWMRRAEDLQAFISEPDYAAHIAPDEASFLDPGALVWMVTNEPTVVIDGPTS